MHTARSLTMMGGCLLGGGGCLLLGGRGVSCDLSHHAFDVTCLLPPHQLRSTNNAAAYILLVGHVTCKACWDTTTPCEQNSWHMLLKILPCPNFVAGGNNIFRSQTIMPNVYFWNPVFSQSNFTLEPFSGIFCILLFSFRTPAAFAFVPKLLLQTRILMFSPTH